MYIPRFPGQCKVKYVKSLVIGLAVFEALLLPVRCLRGSGRQIIPAAPATQATFHWSFGSQVAE